MRTARLDARIRQIVGERPYEIVWQSVYRFQSRCADRMRVGRVLLAGDCAHLYAPFGARGLNSGVPDAENAAWKLAFVLHGWAPEELLETYHLERHAAAVENLEVTSATMRFLVPPDEAHWSRRRALLDAAVADPAKVVDVDSGRFAEPFWYVDSPLTTADATRPFGGRPARGQLPTPGPGILIPDAPVTGGRRLRELVRDGLLLLTTSSVELDTGPVRIAQPDRTGPRRRRARSASRRGLADSSGRLCLRRAHRLVTTVAARGRPAYPQRRANAC